jgi:hypothetical protein
MKLDTQFCKSMRSFPPITLLLVLARRAVAYYAISDAKED